MVGTTVSLKLNTYSCTFSVSIDQPLSHNDRGKYGLGAVRAGILHREQKTSHKQCKGLSLYSSNVMFSCTFHFQTRHMCWMHLPESKPETKEEE